MFSIIEYSVKQSIENKIMLNDGIPLETKAKIIRVLNALFPDTKIILFGSRARGTFSNNSDIDLALDAGKQLEFYDVGEAKAMFAESNIIHRIDILDLNNVSDRLKNIILREGKEWKL